MTLLHPYTLSPFVCQYINLMISFPLILIVGSQDNYGQQGPQEVSSLTSCLKAGSALRSGQVVQGFIQLGLEKLQGWE